MSSKAVLFKTIFMKEWRILKSYAFNLVMSILSIYILFLFVFYGMKAMASPIMFDNTAEGIIIGFLLWITSILSVETLSWDLMEEAKVGTLEQISMTPFGLGSISFFKILSSFVLNFIFIIPIFLLMMLTTGMWLYINILSLLPLFIFALASVWGLSFMLGGLVLIFKRIQAVFQLIQWLLLGCIILSASAVSVFLPLAFGTRLIGEIMVSGASLLSLSPVDLLMLMANGAIYLGIGYFIFGQCIKISKKKGLLGQY
jgi:hypothetical protein